MICIHMGDYSTMPSFPRHLKKFNQTPPVMKITDDTLGQLDQLIKQHMDSTAGVGVALTIICAEHSLIRTYGQVAVDDPTPVSADSLFAIGSLSKSFTCLCLMILEEAGLLSLTDPLSTHLSLDLNDREDQIQLRHLMSHSSGIPECYLSTILEAGLGLRPAYRGIQIDVDMHDWNDLFSLLESHRDFITTDPGVRFHYADIGFSLLAYVIEQVTGLSYGQVIDIYVFSPLGMSNSTTRSTFQHQDHRIRGHFIDNGQTIPVAANYPGSSLIDGGGGVMTSISDLQRYLQLMLDSGRGMISPEQFQQLTSPQIALNPEQGSSYGYGWFIYKTDLGPMLLHPGHTGASTSITQILPDQGLAFSILNNSDQSLLPLVISIEQVLQIDLGIQPAVPPAISHVGTYSGMAGLEQVVVKLRHSDLYLSTEKFSILGVEHLDRPLHHVRTEDGTAEYYYVQGQRKIRVIFETSGDRQWMTVGRHKYYRVE